MAEEITSLVIGEDRDRELLNRARYATYKSTPEGNIGYYCYEPNRAVGGVGLRPAIIFFHGGMYDQSMPAQFAPHCLHFAHRGIAAFSVEYRVSAVNGTDPTDALEDARDFVNHVIERADEIGIDPSNFILAGAASGAHLALHLSSRHMKNVPFVESLPKPKALVLYSPVTNTTTKGITSELYRDEKQAKLFSPSEQITKDQPPMIVFHGKADTAIPFQQSEKFVKLWKRKKNRAEFIDFETARHIDFNFNVNPQLYELTLRSADRFLVDLGFLVEDDEDHSAVWA